MSDIGKEISYSVATRTVPKRLPETLRDRGHPHALKDIHQEYQDSQLVH